MIWLFEFRQIFLTVSLALLLLTTLLWLAYSTLKAKSNNQIIFNIKIRNVTNLIKP